jgi:hypothetical protein
MNTEFWLLNLKRRDHSKDLDVDRKKILEFILGKLGCEGVNWFNLAQDRDQWRVLLNTVMNFVVP